MIHVTSSSFDSDTRQSDTDVHQQSNTLQLMALPVQSSGVSHPILAETTESKPLNTSESQLQVPNMTSERSQSFTDVSELQQQRRRSITMDNAVIDRLNMARMAMFIPNNTDSNTSVTIGSANETISGSVTQSGNIAVKKSSATIESIKKRGQQFSIFRRNSTNPSPKNSANAIPTINIIVSGVSTPEAISRQELSVSRSQQFSQTSIRATVAEEEELDAMGALGPSRIQAQQLKQQEQQQQQPARRLSLLASSVSWIKALSSKRFANNAAAKTQQDTREAAPKKQVPNNDNQGMSAEVMANLFPAPLDTSWLSEFRESDEMFIPLGRLRRSFLP